MVFTARSGFVVAWAVVIGSVAEIAACSGQTTVDGGTTRADAGTTAGADAGGGGGTGTGTLAPGCPATDPGQSAPCAKEGLLCEYGADFNPLCNSVRVCSSGGTWASPVFYGSAASCPTTPPSVPPNPAGCAASPSAVPVDQACSGALTCEYDGAHCFCGPFCPSFPTEQQKCDADAGIVDNCCDAAKLSWHCFTGPAYCPSPRPRVGTACATGAGPCAVEVPGECGQTLIECRDGVWNVRNDGCPISTARAKEAIAYVGADDADRLREGLMAVRLATYRYKQGDEARHRGFVIEDLPPGSPAVLPARDRVDLYGYVSMAVAALQQHDREIAALRADVARLSAENAALRGRARPAKP